MAPWESKKQQRWGHSPAGKEALTDKEVKEFDDSTNFDAIPEKATAAEPKPKKFDVVKTIRKTSRDNDPHKGSRRGGFHSPPKGKKSYTRKEKHPGQSNSEALTPEDETYREISYPLATALNWGGNPVSIEAALDWSTHKAETFNDTGEKGLHPAWGLKSVIDRGVKPHEKPGADKRIGEGENQTQKRDIPSKTFKSYSMVNAFRWDISADLPFEGAAPPFGSKDEDEIKDEGEVEACGK